MTKGAAHVIHRTIGIYRMVQYFEKATFFMGAQGRCIALSNMGIHFQSSHSFKRLPHKGFPIAFSSKCRGSLQCLQQQPILIRLQTQGADIAVILFQYQVSGILCPKENLLQILIELLLCQCDLPSLRLIRPQISTVFQIAFCVDFHQLAEGKVTQRFRNDQLCHHAHSASPKMDFVA